MPTQVIKRIFAEYGNARDEQFSGHDLADFIRHRAPAIFANATPKYANIVWRASAGQSKWAETPWIAAFNPIVTTSASAVTTPFSSSLAISTAFTGHLIKEWQI